MPTARTLRLNELLQRELSGLLHLEYQTESVTITIGGVDVAPDLTGCRVHVAVTGNDDLAADRLRWLRRHAGALRSALARRIVLKHLPALTFELDSATQRGNRILAVLDEIVAKDKSPPPAEVATAAAEQTGGSSIWSAVAAAKAVSRQPRRRHDPDAETATPRARRTTSRRPASD